MEGKFNGINFLKKFIKQIQVLTFIRLVYNVRDLSTDPKNERDSQKEEVVEESRLQVNNPYGQDILGNTEVDLELQQIQGDRSLPRLPNLSMNRPEGLEESVNSPRLVNHDTEVPQHLVTSVGNNEFRQNPLQLVTENNENSVGDPGPDSVNINNYFDNLSTERGNDMMNNGIYMNNSNSNLLNNSVDKKGQRNNVSTSQNIPKGHDLELSSQKSASAVCKICLSEEEDPQGDPLVSPCKCTGTVKYMHVSCLKEWIKAKCKISDKDY